MISSRRQSHKPSNIKSEREESSDNITMADIPPGPAKCQHERNEFKTPKTAPTMLVAATAINFRNAVLGVYQHMLPKKTPTVSHFSSVRDSPRLFETLPSALPSNTKSPKRTRSRSFADFLPSRRSRLIVMLPRSVPRHSVSKIFQTTLLNSC